MNALVGALTTRTRDYQAALDRIDTHIENDPEAWDAREKLREAIELVRCLRRLCDGRTVDEIHSAFGAPGDFGYDTPIGDALALIYRGGS